METLTINGIRYQVIHSDTPDQTEAVGHAATADFMRRDGRSRHLIVKRPSGRKHYFAIEWPNADGSKSYRLVTGAL